ncbi:MAG: insulinase family protein [Ignavibacteriales bacterium CG12_big_fil_rev_8_21_14_0_65_30_8]|nr:MAG: insulinase family protein [Ignavibacteriales bacterium CG12_big_fil_rev_8_21_14_0_65_30_8]
MNLQIFTDLSRYKKSVLPNGVKIITETIPYVKSFSLGFWLNVGSRDEKHENNGISHVIEHMLFKGTTTRSAKKIAEDVEACGGYLNAFTSKEHTCYYGRGLEDHLETTFDVLSDMIQNPVFKTTELKRESKVIIDELNDIEDSPEELIFDKFEENLYSGYSLAQPVIGTAKNIISFSSKDLFDFIKENYNSNNLTIAASGSIAHEEIVRLAKKYLKNITNIFETKRKEKIISKNSGLNIIEKEIQQVHVIIGRSTYGFKDPERLKLLLLSQILGEGSSSRLFQSLRERNGIAYQINTFLNSFYDVSSFGVYFSTNFKMIDKALNLVMKEFKKLKEKKISEKELSRAKESFKGGLLLSLENTSNRMIRMAQSELYFGRVVPIDEVIKKINSYTREDVLELAKKVLKEESFIKIILKSKDAVLKTAA